MEVDIVESKFEPPTTPAIETTEKNTKLNSLPEKSRKKYKTEYITFKKWQRSKNIKVISENAMITYFTELSEKKAPTTLWSIFSMLKATIDTHENIHIGNFSKLITFLKKNSKGFVSKRAKMFTAAEIETFLLNAPDHIHLATKVTVIFGITGAFRTDDFTKIESQNVENHGNILLVKITDDANKVLRSVTIEGEMRNIVQKYIALRPPKTITTRFFLNFQNGRCTTQPIGKHKFEQMPKKIAEFLKLEDPHIYTGHSFRRTSITLRADAEPHCMTLRQHSGWESTNATEVAHISNDDQNKVTDAEENSFYAVYLEDVKIKKEIEENVDESNQVQSRVDDVHEPLASEVQNSQNIPGFSIEEWGDSLEEFILQDLNFKSSLKTLAQPLIKQRLNSCQEELRSQIQKTTAEIRKLQNQIKFIDEVACGTIKLTELLKKGSNAIFYIASKYDENPVLAMENKNMVAFNENGTDHIFKLYEYLWSFSEDKWMNTTFKNKLIEEHEKKSEQLEKLEKTTTQDLLEGLKQKILNICTKVVNQIVV